MKKGRCTGLRASNQTESLETFEDYLGLETDTQSFQQLPADGGQKEKTYDEVRGHFQ